MAINEEQVRSDVYLDILNEMIMIKDQHCNQTYKAIEDIVFNKFQKLKESNYEKPNTH